MMRYGCHQLLSTIDDSADGGPRVSFHGMSSDTSEPRAALATSVPVVAAGGCAVFVLQTFARAHLDARTGNMEAAAAIRAHAMLEETLKQAGMSRL